MNKTLIRMMSLGLTLLGGVVSLATNWADDKKLDMKIEEKLEKKLKDHEEEEES